MDAHQLVLVIAESREESCYTKSDSANIDRVTTLKLYTVLLDFLPKKVNVAIELDTSNE